MDRQTRSHKRKRSQQGEASPGPSSTRVRKQAMTSIEGDDKTSPVLLRLPAERRNTIWTYVFCGDRIELDINNTTPQLPSLAKVCRQTLVEVIGIFLLESRIRMTIVDYNGAWEKCIWYWRRRLEQFLRDFTGDEDFKVAVDSISLNMQGSPNWSHTLAWAKAIHTARAQDILAVFIDPEASSDFKVNGLALNAAIDCTRDDLSWTQTEQVLELMHQVAAAKDPDWR